MSLPKLPDEIWLKISNTLVEQRELRTMANLHKALNWDTPTNIFQKELIRYRRESQGCKDYNQSMIEFWERTGIDDGVPMDYLKIHLNKKRIFRTMWARVICCGKFYDMIANCIPNWHNRCVEFTNNIIEDNRKYYKYYKYKHENEKYGHIWPCKKMLKLYIKDISLNTKTYEELENIYSN
jgi:hypothetical protein